MNVVEPAFPRMGVETDLTGDGSGGQFPHVYSYEEAAGLTKREYFAIRIMQALATGNNPAVQSQPQHMARDAVNAADALIEALRHSGNSK
jgi:hypothetical protein